MSRSEKSILNETLVDVSALPATCVWRNNTGMAWQGRLARVKPGDYIKVEYGMTVLYESRPIRFGLEGSSDIIGASAGRPLAVETKTATGPQREQQKNFERAWTKAGGIYILARTPQEAIDALR